MKKDLSDLTLNQKINKVIEDIKALNLQKQKEFGCSRLTSNEQKQQRKYIKIDDLQQNERREAKQSNYTTQNLNYGKRLVLEDEQSSCQFDLTSAKEFNSINQRDRKFISSPKYKVEQNKEKENYNKYENILAAPGSIYVEQQLLPTKKTIIDDLLASNRSQEEQNVNIKSQNQTESIQQNAENIQINYEQQLREEREQTIKLRKELSQKQYEQEIYDELVQEQLISKEIKEQELLRARQKSIKLQKALAREKCIKESLSQQTGYSNPAKLMNYLKMKKSQNNKEFKNVNQYVSHIEAFSRLSSKMTQQEQQEQKQIITHLNKRQQSFKDSSVQDIQQDQEEQINLKTQLEIQRKALRDFSNYCQFYNK